MTRAGPMMSARAKVGILACVGAEAQDRENDLEDEAEDPNPDHGDHWSLTEDSEPNYDNEYSDGRSAITG